MLSPSVSCYVSEAPGRASPACCGPGWHDCARTEADLSAWPEDPVSAEAAPAVSSQSCVPPPAPYAQNTHRCDPCIIWYVTLTPLAGLKLLSIMSVCGFWNDRLFQFSLDCIFLRTRTLFVSDFHSLLSYALLYMRLSLSLCLKLKKVLWLSCVAYGLVFKLSYSAQGDEYLGHRSISETTLNITPGMLLFSLRVNLVYVLFVSS